MNLIFLKTHFNIKGKTKAYSWIVNAVPFFRVREPYSCATCRLSLSLSLSCPLQFPSIRFLWLDYPSKIFWSKSTHLTCDKSNQHWCGAIPCLQVSDIIHLSLVWMDSNKTWELWQTDQKYLESFEMWRWRKMEKISRTDRVENEEVLYRSRKKRSILHILKRRKANWIDEILRRNFLLKHVIEGNIERTGTRGIRRKQILDDLEEKKRYWNLRTYIKAK